MKITTKKERYAVEVLPSILVTWHFGKLGVYFGWLIWNICFDF